MRAIRCSISALAAVAAASLCLATGPGWAQEGELDTTFNLTGVFHHSPATTSETIRVLDAPDDWLVLLGRSEFSGGAGGSDFWKKVGDNGFTGDCFLVGGDLDYFFAADAVIDHAGRLVVVGTDGDNHILVARYLFPACTRDPDFGTNGVVTSSSGLWGTVQAAGVVERSSGTILPTYTYFVLAQHDGSLVVPRGEIVLKYLADGTPDTGWGAFGGWVSPDFGSEIVVPRRLAVDPVGRLVTAFDVLESDLVARDFGVARLQAANGALDTTFSGDGYERIPFDLDGALSDDAVVDMAVGSDSRIALVGAAPSSNGQRRPTIAVLEADGDLDPTFDGNGKRQLSLEGWARAVKWVAGGRLVVAGQNLDLGFDDESFVVRLLADGANDPGYGSGGFASFFALDFGGADDVATSVALDGDRVVVGGWGKDSAGDRNAYLMRFTGPPAPPDPHIFSDGFVSGTTSAWSAVVP